MAAAFVGIGLVLSVFAWRWYRSFPDEPTRLSIAQGRAQLDVGGAPWMVTDELTIDCRSERSENSRMVVPATVREAASVLVVVFHPQVERCTSLVGRPLVGLLTRADPRRAKYWVESGFLVTNSTPTVDVLMLDTDGGPPDARLLLYFALGMVAFGVAFYVVFRRELRNRAATR